MTEQITVPRALLVKANEAIAAGRNTSETLDEIRSALTAANSVSVGPQARCQYCDGTGDVHTPTGEWRGSCDCESAQTHAYAESRADQATEPPSHRASM